MRVSHGVVLICCICSVATITYGAGFSIFEQGAAATGMAGAFTAQADDASAVFYNPAGITQLEGTHVSVGGTIITTDSTLTDSYTHTDWDADKQVFFPPNLYITHSMNDRISLGLGLFAPYGLGMKWDNNDNFIYRYLINEVNLASFYINPVVAFKINDTLSIAAGLYYVMSDVEYKASIDMSDVSDYLSYTQGVPITLPDGSLKLTGDTGSGEYGFNLGLHAKMEKFRLGVTYRSEVECNYEGDAKFKVTPTGYGPAIDTAVAALFPDTIGKTQITMPASASLGFAYQLTDRFLMELDINWMGWSSYDSLNIDFENPSLPDKDQVKDWDDVMSYRLGARYAVNEKFNVYGGYLFDESPVPDETLDPILPDADRQALQIGAGYTIGALTVDMSYMALLFDDRETDTNYLGLNGDYSSFSNLIGLQFSYSF